MLKRCRICGSSNFRVSHFRVMDLPLMLVLRYPVRCRHCHERAYAFVPQILNFRGGRQGCGG